MSNQVRVISLIVGAGVLLTACTANGGGEYYDPYPYRSDIYYHHYDYYDRDRPSNPPQARPPMRPRHLPARGGGRGGRGGRR